MPAFYAPAHLLPLVSASRPCVENIYRSFQHHYSGTPSSQAKDEQMAEELAAVILVSLRFERLSPDDFSTSQGAISTDRRLPQGLHSVCMELAFRPNQLRERLLALVPEGSVPGLYSISLLPFNAT
jgi:hypothetical protein